MHTRRTVQQADFNPRSPHGERPARFFCILIRGYFNPRSPHGERLLFRALRRAHIVISTHAPRTGSDAMLQVPPLNLPISTHAPRTGSDLIGEDGTDDVEHFNPRSPHGERLRSSRAFLRAV